jgi:5-methylcytosine-specific restriction endonuclease McrA
MKETKIKTCKIHGETSFQLNTQNKWICPKCRNDNKKKHRKTIKAKAVEYMGGECQRCGYNKYIGALDFHHLDPTKKDINFSSLKKQSLSSLIKELENCILVCSNCHREIHEEIRQTNIHCG